MRCRRRLLPLPTLTTLFFLALPILAAEVIVHDFDDATTLGWIAPGSDGLSLAAPGPSGRSDDRYLTFGDVADPDQALALVAPAQITGGLHGVAATCGALELDFRVVEDNGEPVPFTVWLAVHGDGFDTDEPSVQATFRRSAPVSRADGWVHVVVPLTLGGPPSGWTMLEDSSPAQWDALLLGADRLWLPLDVRGTAETYGVDNVRLVTGDCARPPASCLPPPRNLAAWWPLEEPAGADAAADLVGHAPGRRVGERGAGPGVVGGAFRFDGGDRVEAEEAPLLDLAAGQDFSIAFWMRTENDSELAVMLEKRDFSRSAHGDVIGWQVFLFDGRPGLQLSDGARLLNFTAPFSVADGAWHLVAVTVDRDSRTGLQWYLDGRAAGRGVNPTGFQADLSNRHRLRLGAGSSPDTNGATFHFRGELDEMAFFRRRLAADEVQKLYAAGSAGMCTEDLVVPSHTSSGCDEATIEVCNHGSGAATYDLALASLPPGSVGPPGLSCSVDGPAGLALLGPATLRVPPGACAPARAAIGFASGAAGGTGCYEVTATPRSGGRPLRQVGSASVAGRVCCGRSRGGAAGIPVFGSQAIAFECRNLTPQPIELRYRLEAVDSAGGVAAGVRLDRGKPGEPVRGEMSLAPGGTAVLPVEVELTEVEVFRPLTVLLRDADLPAPDDVLSSQAVRSVAGGRPESPATPSVTARP